MQVNLRRIVTSLALGILSMLLFSCVKNDDVKVVAVDGFNLVSMSKVEVRVVLENKSNSNILLKNALLKVYNDKQKAMDIVLEEPVMIAKRSTHMVTIPLRLKITNTAAVFQVVKNLENMPEKVFITGNITARAGLLVKKIKFEDVALSNFIPTLWEEQGKIAI